MTSGIRINGTDTDDLFEPYRGGNQSGNTNVRSGGQDFSQRYQFVNSGYGSGPAYGTTGLKTYGTDLGGVYVRKGSWTPPQTALTLSIAPDTTSIVIPGKGTYYAQSAIVATASGGTGSYTYQDAVLEDSSGGYSFFCTRTNNSYQFRAVNTTTTGHGGGDATWQISVSDGQNTASTQIVIACE